VRWGKEEEEEKGIERHYKQLGPGEDQGKGFSLGEIVLEVLSKDGKWEK